MVEVLHYLRWISLLHVSLQHLLFYDQGLLPLLFHYISLSSQTFFAFMQLLSVVFCVNKCEGCKSDVDKAVDSIGWSEIWSLSSMS